MIITIRRAFKYRLYQNRRNKHLHRQIDVAGIIWNHCVALQRRYYRLTGGYINKYRLMKHVAKLRMRTERYTYWRIVGSQAVQDIVERLDQAYQEFFKYKRGETTLKRGRPRFKKVKKYSSLTLKQAGWKLLGGNRVTLGDYNYKYAKSREIEGKIKTVTIKRDRVGRLFICFSVVQEIELAKEVSTGKIGGFDFGLKVFLTDDEGRGHPMPQYFKENLEEIARLNRALSRTQPRSRNREKARRRLARAYARLANKRQDYHFKLARALAIEYDVLFFEDLNVKAMQQMWGRKVSDLGFSEFFKVLEHIAKMMGKEVILIDRFEPTTTVCSVCGHQQPMPLHVRVFGCQNPVCGVVLDRDHNAAINIKRVGASTLWLEGLRRDLVPAALA